MAGCDETGWFRMYEGAGCFSVVSWDGEVWRAVMVCLMVTAFLGIISSFSLCGRFSSKK